MTRVQNMTQIWAACRQQALNKQVFKHGVQLTLRGNYLDLLQYVKALESLPQQMYLGQGADERGAVSRR